MRRSLIRNSITSEAKKIVRVSASYRPSSKVMGCADAGRDLGRGQMFGGHKSGPMNAGVSRLKSSAVSHAR